jgi:hypothetical protein
VSTDADGEGEYDRGCEEWLAREMAEREANVCDERVDGLCPARVARLIFDEPNVPEFVTSG